MARVYAACAFNEAPGAKTYDYTNEVGAKVGDKVKVPSRDGTKTVFVKAIKSETDCPKEWLKPIVEIVPVEDKEDEKT